MCVIHSLRLKHIYLPNKWVAIASCVIVCKSFIINSVSVPKILRTRVLNSGNPACVAKKLWVSLHLWSYAVPTYVCFGRVLFSWAQNTYIKNKKKKIVCVLVYLYWHFVGYYYINFTEIHKVSFVGQDSYIQDTWSNL